jgi:hypothetical protein
MLDKRLLLRERRKPLYCQNEKKVAPRNTGDIDSEDYCLRDSCLRDYELPEKQNQ